MTKLIETTCVLSDKGVYYVMGREPETDKRAVIVLYEKDPSAKTAVSQVLTTKNFIFEDKEYSLPLISFTPSQETCLFAHSAFEDENPDMIAYFQQVLAYAILRQDTAIYLADPETSVQLFLEDGDTPDLVPVEKSLDPSIKAGVLENRISELVTEWMERDGVFSLQDIANYVFGKLRENFAITRTMQKLSIEKMDVVDFLDEILQNMAGNGILKKDGNVYESVKNAKLY